MEVTLTCKLKLQYPLEEAKAFVASYTAACNYISVAAFSLPDPSNKKQLNDLCYKEVREKFGLKSQVAQSAIRCVAARYATLKSLKRSAKEAIVFTGEPVLLQQGKDFGFSGNQLSITTRAKRILVSIEGPPRLARCRKDWKLGGALLWVNGASVYLGVTFSQKIEEKEDPNCNVTGGDRGMKNLLVATNGKKQRFFGGGKVRHRVRHYQEVRASVQSKKALHPTHSLRKLEKRLSGKESRFRIDTDHVVSKRFVEFMEAEGSIGAALEDLAGIRDRCEGGKDFRREFHNWSFARLQVFIVYKASLHGFRFFPVHPAYTSQGCSRCGLIDKANRVGVQFKCVGCGYRLHADLNAARNIRRYGIFKWQDQLKLGALSGRPQVQGSSRTSLVL